MPKPASRPKGRKPRPFSLPKEGTICFIGPPDGIHRRAVEHQRKIVQFEGQYGGSLPIINDLRRKLGTPRAPSTDFSKHIKMKADRIMFECKLLADTTAWRMGQMGMGHQWGSLYTSAIMHALNKAGKEERAELWRAILERHQKEGKIIQQPPS